MNRINGFINLDEMINNGDIKKLDITYENSSINDLDIFLYNDDIYFYKSTMTDPYNELVAEEILSDFNLPSATYDLALYKGNKGVITKSFRKKDKKYIGGEELIEDYLKHIYKGEISNISTTDYNNLEGIWNALDYRYKDKDNRKEIVYNIVDKLVDMFIFDILTGNYDRYSSNYEIEEDNNSAELAPIFDNEKMLKYTILSFGVSNDENSSRNLYMQLDNFMKISDYSYIERIKDKLWIIDKDNLTKIFNRIENKTQFKMSDELKENYYSKFAFQKEKLEEILNEYKTIK